MIYIPDEPCDKLLLFLYEDSFVREAIEWQFLPVIPTKSRSFRLPHPAVPRSCDTR
jgi:hypothetical protein